MPSESQDNLNRSLTLIRHAKSAWDKPGLADKQRSLAKRGIDSAETMALRHPELLASVQQFYSSTAQRAMQTIQLLASFCPQRLAPIRYEEALYTFDGDDLLQFVSSLTDGFHHIALVGHNPAMTEMINQLCDARLDNLPTCGIVSIRFNCNHWHEIQDAESRLVLLDYPKK